MASQLGAKVLLLDDGMQYRRLKKHVEIVVLNGSDPFGGGSFLPGGFLRDEPSRLRQADLIVIHGPLKNLKHLDRIERFSSAPIVYAHSSVQGVQFLEEERAIDLKATPVAVFCGIAAPHRFVETVENEIGANVVLTHFLGDHQGWTQEAFEKFLSQAKERGCVAVLCTEKDAVKLKNTKKSCVPVAWVKRELTIQKNEEALEALVLTIKTRMIQ